MQSQSIGSDNCAYTDVSIAEQHSFEVRRAGLGAEQRMPACNLKSVQAFIVVQREITARWGRLGGCPDLCQGGHRGRLQKSAACRLHCNLGPGGQSFVVYLKLNQRSAGFIQVAEKKRLLASEEGSLFSLMRIG